jgi:NAD(P)-dependent dehydrogenase (short-subunit alcohol dehydrogenase family)
MSERSRDLDGKVAMMIGTSANIGAGIAIGLGEAKAKVACVDRNLDAAEHTADDIVAGGGTAIAIECDTTDEGEVLSAVERATDELGVVDVLVNGAAFYNFKGITTMSVGEWRAQLSVILDSAFLVTQAVIRQLIAEQRAGSVTTLTSTAAYQGEPGNIAYCTAKSGLINFTRSLAMELAPHGIRANSVSPTGTDLTEAAERAHRWGIAPPTAEAIEIMRLGAQLLPLGRAPSPSHYADAIVFLASDAAELITGMDMRVDAGATAKYWRSSLTSMNSDD